MMMRGRRMFFFAPLAVAGLVLFIFIGGTVVRLLWNALLPELFGWPVVTFWQALGLLVLSRILFGGLGRHGGKWRGRGQMTPEERDQMRQRMRERFGFGRPRDIEHPGAPPPVV